MSRNSRLSVSSKIFTPDSWRKAGGAVEDAGGDVASRIRSRLGSVQPTGEGGLTLLDELPIDGHATLQLKYW